jgi:hypothetical protein
MPAFAPLQPLITTAAIPTKDSTDAPARHSAPFRTRVVLSGGISMSVMPGEPQGDCYGGTVAAPALPRFMSLVLNSLRIAP